MSGDNIDRATAWYIWRRKGPTTTDDGRWQWVLLDVEFSRDRESYELPEAVFNRLKSDQERPWLFATEWDAGKAVILAVARAIEAGELA